jgi:hypothetical protein
MAVLAQCSMLRSKLKPDASAPAPVVAMVAMVLAPLGQYVITA